LSTSKKPGTDLAALKARLAKKTKGKDEPAAAASPMEQQQQHYAPESELPPPGHAAPPRVEHYHPEPQHLPPPGVAAHQHVAPSMGHAAPAVAPPSDDPFGGGAGTFDPAEGMLDAGGGGEVQGKSGIGLVIFAAVLGAVFGVPAGYLGHKMVDNRDRQQKGQAKGEEMAAAVAGIVSARIDVANAMDGLEEKMAADPAGAAVDIEALLADKWESQVNISQLFGWQLAAVHPNGVKNTFQLFEEATRVKKDLQFLQAFLATQPEALQRGQGPSQFAVLFTSSGANMVAALEPLCAGAAEGAPPGPCADGDFSKAVAYKVMETVSGEPKVVPRGTGEGQATLIASDGDVYAYAVGLEPNRNAVIYRNGLVQRVREHLESMAKIEKIAQKALEKYSQDPTVDGSVEQPDPEAGEGQ
jgi:hypothetical protein